MSLEWNSNKEEVGSDGREGGERGREGGREGERERVPPATTSPVFNVLHSSEALEPLEKVS